MPRTSLTRVAAAAVAAAAMAGAPSAAAQAAPLANRCFTLRSPATGAFVSAGPAGYRADRPSAAGAAAFYLKPTGL